MALLLSLMHPVSSPFNVTPYLREMKLYLPSPPCEDVFDNNKYLE